MRLLLCIPIFAPWLLCVPEAAAAEPLFPLKASLDGRHLVDQKNRPFFYHADTAWQLPKRLRPAEAADYLDDVRRRGFTAIQIQTFAKEEPPMANFDGLNPFDPPDDILKPVEAYWQNVDAVLEGARERDLLVAVAPLWIRWGGRDPHGWRYQLNESNARPYGRFLGKRYRGFHNIVWILGGDANPLERSRALAEIAAGIREFAPHQLIVVHNRPEYASAAFFQPEAWLGINLAYTYQETYIHVLGEYNRPGKARPILLGESGYEQESNDGRGGEPHRIRRQVYHAVLNGALGGHAYGHRNIWRFSPAWRGSLDAPGRRQMAHAKQLFASRAWYKLVPDQSNELIVGGRGYFGELDYVSAARTQDGALAILYLPQARTITLDLGKMNGRVKASWFDPTDGSYLEAAGTPFPDSRRQQFTPPARNAAADADFLLLLER